MNQRISHICLNKHLFASTSLFLPEDIYVETSDCGQYEHFISGQLVKTKTSLSRSIKRTSSINHLKKYVSVFKVCCFCFFALFLDGLSSEASDKMKRLIIGIRLLDSSSYRSSVSE